MLDPRPRVSRCTRVLIAIALAVLGPPVARAAEIVPKPPVAASLRATEAHATVKPSARSWANDATLVYAESADSVMADGSARGGHLVYWSPTLRTARGFTTRTNGALVAFAFTAPFDPPAIEDGWLDPVAILALATRDPQARPRVRGSSVLVLSRGLVTSTAPTRGVWLLTEPDANAEWIFDALRGNGGRRNLTQPPSVADDARAATTDMPPYLVRFRTRFDARIETLRATETVAPGKERARWLAAREADALARLSGQDAAWDTLGRAHAQAAGADVNADLATLARWRERTAKADSTLAQSRSRLAAVERDLAASRPTQLAVYVSSEKRARPVRVSVLVDGAEVSRALWGETQWNALDAGAWAEVARVSVRPGARQVRVEIEDGDRRVGASVWSGSIPEQSLQLLRVRLPGPGEGADPAVSPIAYAGTRP